MKPALIVLLAAAAGGIAAGEVVLEAGQRHLRSGDSREWNSFPERAEGREYTWRFSAKRNEAEQTLRLRHRDVKAGGWALWLNGKPLQRLPVDERDMVLFVTIAPGALVDGENELRIAPQSQVSDDILVGDIRLIDRPPSELTGDSAVELTVVDRDTRRGLPCRVTIVDSNGSLVPLGAASTDDAAVRTGTVYSRDGKVRFGLPAGNYVIYASRGFEYSADSVRVSLKRGDRVSRALAIRREVPVPGYASCDTHIHTLEHSGHGDASVRERLLTIAGEGLELAIATEHGKHADYGPEARRLRLDRYFTTVVGNEVTTPVGHFNVFPVPTDARPPDQTRKTWAEVFAEIFRVPGVQAVVLNHARDNHAGFRPFAPDRHLASAGENLEGWELKANAMELVNSGATQSDVLRLFHDWFGLLNRGLLVTGVGASDSHAVDYKAVAQSRTYIATPDGEPGRIDVAVACRSLREGRAMVSFGLLADIRVQDRFGPGDQVLLRPNDKEIRVALRVLGPSWSTADHVALYANGVKVRESRIPLSRTGGVKWSAVWRVPRPAHDVHLVAIATGPGVLQPFWEVRKPSQPVSKDWTPRVLGATNPVWIDGDGDGQITSAYGYADRLAGASAGIPELLRELGAYDEAVAIQAARLLHVRGRSPLEEPVSTALLQASAAVRRGFARYAEEWKRSQD
jgi:hypothetical protein